MASSSTGVLIIIIMIITFMTSSTAEIRSSKIRPDSSRIIQLDNFVFTQSGRLELNVSKLSLSSSLTTNLSKVGFFLCPSSELAFGIIYNDTLSCALESDIIKPIYNFSEGVNSSFNIVYHEFNDTDRYVLMFANCEDVKVSMDVVSAMYNLNGKSRSYLSAGFTNLPRVYIIFGFIYFTMSTAWAYLLFRKKMFDVCHFYMLVLVLTLVIMKSLSLLSQAIGMMYTNRTGSVAIGWDVSFCVFSFLDGVFFFTLLLWIANSWKQFIRDEERNLVILVIALRILASIAALFIHVYSFYVSVWILLLQILFWVVDVVCWFIVLAKYVFSFIYLEEEASVFDSSGPKAAHILMVRKRFRWYFFVVCCYFFFARYVLSIVRLFTSYKDQWTLDLASEALHLSFYVLTCCIFKPEAEVHNQYILSDVEAGL